MATFVPRFLRQLRDIVIATPADGQVLTYDSADGKWKNEAGGGGGDVSTAVILAPASSARNVIQPTAGAVIAAIVKAHAAQSVDLTQWQLSDGTLLSGISKAGGWRIQPSEFDTIAISLSMPPGAVGNFTSFVEFRTNEVGDEDHLVGDIDSTGYMRLTNQSSGAGFDFSTNQSLFPDNAFKIHGPLILDTDGSLLGALNNGVIVPYTDPTNGAARVMWKGTTLDGTSVTWEFPPGVYSPGGGAPTGATYITQTPDAGLSAEQALSALATGLLKNTTTTGVLSIAAAGTDYAAASHAHSGADITSGTVVDARIDAAIARDSEVTAAVAAEASARTTADGLLVPKSLYDANTVLAANSDDTPAALTMGASTILARLAAGNIKAASVAEIITLLQAYTVGGTDVALADGGTGASLTDPNADRILFWDDSAGSTAFLTPGTNLTITGTTLDAASGGGIAHARKSGSYYTVIPSTADATLLTIKDQVYYMPFPVYTGFTIDRLSLGVSGAGGAGSVVRLGLYNSDANGQPSTLLLDAGTINGTSATYQEITVSQILAANTLYWAAVCSQVGTAATVRALGAGNGSEWVLLATNAGDPRQANYIQTGVTGAFGSATPAAGGTTSPAVKVRAA